MNQRNRKQNKSLDFNKSLGFKSSSKRRRGKPRRRFKEDHVTKWVTKIYGPIYQEISLGVQLDLPSSIKDEGKAKSVQKWYRIWRTKRLKRFIGRMPFFASMVFGVDRAKMSSKLKEHILWYEELVRSKGPVYAVKLLKRVRDACVRFAADQTFETINELALHEDGLPLKVGHLMEWLKSGSIKERRAAIHVLDIIKLCEVQGDDPSTSSMTDTARGADQVTNSFIGETFLCYGKTIVDDNLLNKVISTFRLELEKVFPRRKQLDRLNDLSNLSDIHMSVRKGPNGPALGKILEDYLAISKSGLLEPITQISALTHNNELGLIIDEIEGEVTEKLGSIRNEISSIDSRLAVKCEPWCKTRYFAICDWFSQSALKGIHKWIFSWLEKQVEDGTMSQELVAETVRNWTKVSVLSPESVIVGVYSLDLSKATDRLPATLQREIIQQIFGKKLSELWYTICTSRTFQVPGKAPIQFEVGQPLGVYSSWAMLALTHHIICRTALTLSGGRRDGKNPLYVVIGDDVAMVGREFADYYSLLMKTILQIDVSPIKGFTPDSRIGRNPLSNEHISVSAEIAKRVYINGEELSTVSPETLISAMEYPADFPTLLRQLRNRGCIPQDMTPVAPIALAATGFQPDTACTFATFPIHPGISEEMLKAAYENYMDLLNFIPWFNVEIPISVSELESMFRWSIRSYLQSTLKRFQENFNKFVELSRKPLKCGERMYHFKTSEYIIRVLLNNAMLNILGLVVETNVLNFQGPGKKLDEIASALNTMTDFELALLGKPKGKKENLHRMRSRVITKLQPFVLQAIKKAKEYFGILLIDAGEQIEFVPHELVDIHHHNFETRELLTHESNKLLHDLTFARSVEVMERRVLEVSE